MILAVSIASIFALPWALEVLKGICQASQDQRSIPIDCRMMASKPTVTCSPVETTVSYSRKSCRGWAAFTQLHQAVGFTRHGRNDHGDFMARVPLALYAARHIANSLYIADGCAAEFHDNSGHEACLLSLKIPRRRRACAFFITRRNRTRACISRASLTNRAQRTSDT